MAVLRWDALSEALKREEFLEAKVKSLKKDNRNLKGALRWIIVECTNKFKGQLDRIKTRAVETLKKGERQDKGK